jgi:hypothetical protein
VDTDAALKLRRQIEGWKAALGRLGVIRSDRDPVCDFAEWWAAQEFGLTLAPTSVPKGHDAVDQVGCKYHEQARVPLAPRDPRAG